MSLILVKFYSCANRLSLLPSFQRPILLFPQSFSLSFRRVGEERGNEVAFHSESN